MMRAWTLLLLAGGCSDGASVAQSSVPRDTTPADTQPASHAVDAFGVAVMRDLAARSSNDNLVFSPYSIASTMAMVYAGARGQTASEIATALSFTSGYPSLGRAFDTIDLSLAARATSAGKGFVVRPSNALWGQRGLVWEQSFLDTLASDFGAGVHLADFETDAEGARAAINAWGATSTDGLLPELLPSGSVDASSRFVLVDAMVLHARWANAFASAAPGTFTLADGTTASVPMMHQKSETSYTSAADYDAVTLPFADQTTSYATTASMTIIVPKDGAWAGFESKLDFRTMRGTTTYVLDLTMPSFSISGATFSLKDTLEALGMHAAFTDAADFTGITSTPLFIEDVLHQARIDVDEQGVTAAAGTAAIGGTTSLPPPATFVVDRPFYFAVTDDTSGTVLFAGRFVHP